MAADGSGSVIFAKNGPQQKFLRLLSDRGLPHGELEPFTVPPFGEGAASSRQVVDRDGRGTACGTDSSRIFCRRFDSHTGFSSDPYQVDEPVVEGGQYDPFVSLTLNGGTAVSWIHLHEETIRVLVRFVSAEGVTISPALHLATFPFLYELRTSVAAVAPDRLVAVWNQIGFDGSDDGIVGRIVSIDGSMGAPFQVNTYTTGAQRLPVVASDGEGDFVVAWSSDGQDGGAHGIYAQRFDRTGTRLGTEFQVSGSYPSDQDRPEIAMDSLGNFVIGYYSGSESEDEGEDTFIRAYRADGTPFGLAVRANEEIAYDQPYGAIALSDSGLIQVAYNSWRPLPGDPFPYHDYDILTRRFVLPCLADEATLCLQGGRFQVRAFWRDYASRRGSGRSVPMSEDSGGFWFFGADNFELLIKILDGCGSNGHFWIYHTGLTDVEIDLLVTDSWTGQVEVFENPLGIAYSPVQTIDLLEGCGAVPDLGLPPAVADRAAWASAGAGSPPSAHSTCVPDATTLCLQEGRFRARSHFETFAGASGAGRSTSFGDDSGFFWFFDSDNVELSVKVIDACALNNRYWVYAAGLTNVAVDLEVVDTLTDLVWTERTDLGEAFPTRLDSSAFGTCLAPTGALLMPFDP